MSFHLIAYGQMAVALSGIILFIHRQTISNNLDIPVMNVFVPSRNCCLVTLVQMPSVKERSSWVGCDAV